MDEQMLWFLTLSTIVVRAAGSNTNLALGRPTWRSYIMEIHFSTYASNAVDGNRDPDTSHGSCMGTDEYAENFNVFISDQEWPVTADQLKGPSCTKCGQYPGIPPRGATVTVRCPPPGIVGQYVYIHRPTTDVMILCEVEVSGDPVWPGYMRGKKADCGGYFYAFQRINILKENMEYEIVDTPPNSSCFAKCNPRPMCLGFVTPEMMGFDQNNCTLVMDRTQD